MRAKGRRHSALSPFRWSAFSVYVGTYPPSRTLDIFHTHEIEQTRKLVSRVRECTRRGRGFNFIDRHYGIVRGGKRRDTVREKSVRFCDEIPLEFHIIYFCVEWRGDDKVKLLINMNGRTGTVIRLEWNCEDVWLCRHISFFFSFVKEINWNALVLSFAFVKRVLKMWLSDKSINFLQQFIILNPGQK